ncbi:MAG: RlmE family RNA methyltransferase [Spirochaetales bacterium]|jgi:23S rRNA (uridine2552-2'-O)-methyltransferase|nr:RlmE family RNA methyltransferase [Spirochaetales bacterium]
MREISDHWTQRAKKEGYPARSVYKLKEIEEKFHVLPRQGRVLDVGASPGSWTQFILRLSGGRCEVVAVDLSPLNAGTPQDNLTFFQGDITQAATIAFLESRRPYDALLSDAAPATTGNRAVDTARSEALVEQVLDIARKTLKPGGACVVKIFQGGGQKRIMDDMKRIFASVKAFKPRATRSESFETYFIGQNKNV